MAIALSMAGSPGWHWKCGSSTSKRGVEWIGVRRAGKRLPAHSPAHLALLDPHTVAMILADETLLADAIVTIDTIARKVAKRFGLRLGMLLGPSRRAQVVITRHVAMYLARMFTDASFAAIGTYFGGRDAATVRHACKATALRLNADQTLAAAVASLEPRGPWPPGPL